MNEFMDNPYSTIITLIVYLYVATLHHQIGSCTNIARAVVTTRNLLKHEIIIFATTKGSYIILEKEF